MLSKLFIAETIFSSSNSLLRLSSSPIVSLSTLVLSAVRVASEIGKSTGAVFATLPSPIVSGVILCGLVSET